jgi:hypothetical protein
MVPSGTFHLSIAGTGTVNATTGHLDILDPVSIVGAGLSATTIQADSTLNDQVFVIDAAEELSIGFTTAISNLTVTGGQTNSALLGVSSGGAMLWEAGTNGTGKLNLSNVGITGNNAIDSVNPAVDDGGGLALFNTASVTTPAQVTISGSLIQNNKALDAGGGIALKGAISLTMSSTTVTGNKAIGGGAQQGGGLFLCVCNNAPTGSTSSPSQIHNSTVGAPNAANIAGASGKGEGGGIWTNQSLTIDQGSFIQNNDGEGAGGGIATSLAGTNDQVVISASTITGNSAPGGSGGGIEVDAGSKANLQLSFNRIVSNTAAVAGTGLANLGTGTVAATEDWWGCNQGPASSPCVTASGSVTSSPFIKLTNTPAANPVVRTNSTQLTASFLQDSSGGTLSASNLGALIGQSVTFGNAVNGSLSNIQSTIQPNGTATATFTVSAGPSASADASVDHATATANIAVTDFSLSISPASRTVNVGTAAGAQYTVTVTAINGFNSPVQLVLPDPAPSSGVTSGGCNPATVNGARTSTCTVNITSSTGPGTYTVTVQGTSGNLQPSVSAQLVVADFAISVSAPTISGAQAIYTVTCSTSTGFNGAPTLSTSIAGATSIQFSNNPLQCPGQSGLTFTPSVSSPASFTVTGTSGSATRSGNSNIPGTATGTVAISHYGTTVDVVTTCYDFEGYWYYCTQTETDSGDLVITIGNNQAVAPYDFYSDSSDAVLAARLTTAINQTTSFPVTARVSGNVITLTSNLIGPVGNYTVTFEGDSGWCGQGIYGQCVGVSPNWGSVTFNLTGGR